MQRKQDVMRKALRAASAVSGQARLAPTPKTLCLLLAVNLCACGIQTERDDARWTLDDQPDVTVDISVDSSDMASDISVVDQGADGSMVLSQPDQGAFHDQGHGLDMSEDLSEDATADIGSDLASCAQEDLAGRWACCEDSAFAAPGCDVCPGFASGPDDPCMRCYEVASATMFEVDPTQCCHRGVYQNNPNATEQDLFAACTPWGPPAPPSFGGLGIDQLLAA